MRFMLLGKSKALREAGEQLIATITNFERLHCNAKVVMEKLSVARVDVALQSMLREESCEQLDARLKELKLVQS